MARLNYSISPDTERSSKAMGMELRISPKHALELCNAIRGMRVEEARTYLEDVVALKRAVPFRHHKRKVGHRRGLIGWDAGRYPQKAAGEMIAILQNAAANAEYKGLDPGDMRISHVATKKGRVLRGWMPRAMGRATPKNTETVTIEMVLSEVG